MQNYLYIFLYDILIFNIFSKWFEQGEEPEAGGVMPHATAFAATAINAAMMEEKQPSKQPLISTPPHLPTTPGK